MGATAAAILVAVLVLSAVVLIAMLRLLSRHPTPLRLHLCDSASVVLILSPLAFAFPRQAAPATLLLPVLGLFFAIAAYAFDPHRPGRGDDRWGPGGPEGDGPEPPWWPKFEREFRRAALRAANETKPRESARV